MSAVHCILSGHKIDDDDTMMMTTTSIVIDLVCCFCRHTNLEGPDYSGVRRQWWSLVHICSIFI